jgi:hypothetical protein
MLYRLSYSRGILNQLSYRRACKSYVETKLVSVSEYMHLGAANIQASLTSSVLSPSIASSCFCFNHVDTGHLICHFKSDAFAGHLRIAVFKWVFIMSDINDINQYAVTPLSRATVKPPESAAAPPSTKTHKVPRKKRLHKEVKELQKASNSELLSTYITRKFQVLYDTILSTFRLSDDRVKHTKARDKRAMLRQKTGYNEALNAFRHEKELFIQRLVKLSRSDEGDLKIDVEATKFLKDNE